MKKLLLFPLLCCSLWANAQSFSCSFETWRDVSLATSDTVLRAPELWNCTDSTVFYAQGFFTNATFSRQVFETNLAHIGAKAAMLVTAKQDTLGVLPAMLTNADISIDMAAFMSGHVASSLLFSGGAPVMARIAAVTAWAKYTSPGVDSGFITVHAIKSGVGAGGSDSIIASGSRYITTSSPAYDLFTINLAYNDAVTVPDLLRIFITSSGKNPQIGSTLFVDDVNVSTLAVNDITASTSCIVFPVPADDKITFNTIANEPGQISIFSVDGRFMMTSEVNPGKPVDVSSLPADIYCYSFTTLHSRKIAKGQFLIKR